MLARSNPPALDQGVLRRALQREYAKFAIFPGRRYHVHTGPRLAEMLGYPASAVVGLPKGALESFCGAAYPFRFGPLASGQTVVDVGSGSGLDALIAGRQVGPAGRVIGVDTTPEMVSKARAAAKQARMANVEFRRGYAEDLPLADGSADVVLSNAVINNLCPDKERALAEIFRVLRPGGRLLLGDVVVRRPIPDGGRAQINLWTCWIAGALPEAEFVDIIGEVGFADVRIEGRVDFLAGAAGEPPARPYGPSGVAIQAFKPGA